MLDSNPFLTKLEIQASELFNKQSKTIHTIVVEKHTPTSIFTSPGLLKVFSSFSPAGKNLFMYILTYIGARKDSIEIIPEVYCERMNASHRSFLRARDELTNLVIVKKKRKNTYYVDPGIIFKGSRIKVFPNKVKVVFEAPIVVQLRELGVLEERNLEKQLDNNYYGMGEIVEPIESAS